MKVVLNSGVTYDVISVADEYIATNGSKSCLNIFMNSDESIETLVSQLNAEDAISTVRIQKDDGTDIALLSEFTGVESVRRIYDDKIAHDTQIMLTH